MEVDIDTPSIEMEDLTSGATRDLNGILQQSNDSVWNLAYEPEKVLLQINVYSVASADVVSECRSSLKGLRAQVEYALNSLDDLQGADEIAEFESIYKDPDYRSDYYHSIHKVEFDDEYGPNLKGNFTVDDLCVVAEENNGIKTLGSLAQFYGHPNSQTKDLRIWGLIAFLINLPRITHGYAKKTARTRSNNRSNTNKPQKVRKTRKVRADTPVVDFNGIDPTFLDAADMEKINELSQQEKSVYVSKVIEACRHLHTRATQQEREDGTIHCVWHIQFWCSYAYWFARSPKTENGCQIWKGPVGKVGSRSDYPRFCLTLLIVNLFDFTKVTNTKVHPALMYYLLTPNSQRIPYNQDQKGPNRSTISHLESNYRCIAADHAVCETYELNVARGGCMQKCAAKCECRPHRRLHLNEQFEVIACRQHPNGDCPEH